MREAVGIFGVFFVGKREWFWNVAEYITSQNVAIGFRPDTKIAVISAGHCNLVEKGGIVRLIVGNLILDVEHVVQIGAFRGVIDEGELVGLHVTCEFFGENVVIKIFDAAKV